MYNKEAIIKAAYNGEIDLVKKIIKTNPDPDARDSFGGTALHAAMFQDNVEIIEILIDNGFDINAVGPANGYVPLHDAVWGNNLDAIKCLIENGANTDIVAKDGLTPYMKAKKEGKSKIIDLFESKGIKK